MSYCLDSPLCIIVTATYSDIEPPFRSASLTSRLQNAPYLLASCHTFCLNPCQSSWGLCRVQVVITGRFIIKSGSARAPPLGPLLGPQITWYNMFLDTSRDQESKSEVRFRVRVTVQELFAFKKIKQMSIQK